MLNYYGHLLLGVSVLAIAANPAFAQTTPQDAAAEAAADATDQSGDDTIVVTGSRLQADPNQTAPSPIVSVTAADLLSTGQTDVSEALREVPALLNSGTIADSLDRGAGGTGQATLNLRSLGSNRTLVLVNGRRHVAGVAGSQIVDIASIPAGLIESVDVLTGGASAVYGADAVTGVVNFKLKDDFDGLSLQAQMGISDKGDARNFNADALFGRNFDEGRGNFVIGLSYANGAELQYGDRRFTRDNRQFNNSTTYNNPLRRFQRGDISAATPNFQQRFSLASGRYPYGFAIPTAAQFATQFPGRTPTTAEQALIDRAANSPTLALGSRPTFAISSNQGLIFFGDFSDARLDVNGNGIADCDESYIGTTGLGGGGCYVSTPGNGVRPFQDGIVSTGSNQYGGDGAAEAFNEQSLIPESVRYNANVNGSYEFSDAFGAFIEAKYSRTETFSQNPYNTFYDSLLIFPDNPFIPTALRAAAQTRDGLRVSRDFVDLGQATSRSDRDTYRVVGGFRGELTPNLRYEVSSNYGRSDNSTTDSNTVLYDRLFAAIDVVQGPGGPRCRSDTDPTPHPGSEFFPVIESGFFTFRPGDGSCRPANILGGANSVSPEAVAFITTPTTLRSRLEQIVFSGLISGDTGGFFTLPGGAVQFAVGAEYREEKSRTNFDPLELGFLPAAIPGSPAGTFIGDITANQSLIFDAGSRVFDTSGKFDVKEAFGEISIPLLADRPFFEVLTIGGAARYSDYSTVGGAFTWNVNGVYAPIQDLRFRGTYAQAIRAPNIAELFSPQQGATFRPADPCNQGTIDSLIAANDPQAQNRLANCRADGIPVGFNDPLTARFSGTSGGNPDLIEETAKTFTAGAVVQPRFLPGLSISGDYYSIEIENAIAAVTAQDIVNSCYDSTSFPNAFCALFTRNRTVGSPTFLGFNFLQQTQLNFGRIETSGVDASISYRFDIGENNFALRAAGNWTEKLNRFFDPGDPTLNNPGIKEIGVPEWSGVGSATWSRDPFSLTYRLQYVSEQGLGPVQFERVDTEFGPIGISDDYYIHDISFTLEVDDTFNLYGGVNNFTDEEPFPTNNSYPVSAVGRYFFLGVNTKF